MTKRDRIALIAAIVYAGSSTGDEAYAVDRAMEIDRLASQLPPEPGPVTRALRSA